MISGRLLFLTALQWLALPSVSIAVETEFGTVVVTQLNGTNNSIGSASSSIRLSLAQGSSPGVQITGGNRADYNVSFGNASDPASGALISCAAQLSRDDSAVGGPASGFHHATTAVQIAGSRYYIPVFRSPEGDEANLNTSLAFFPFQDWLCGVTGNSGNDGEITSLTASPGLLRGTHFIDLANPEGEYLLNLDPLAANASQTGVLLVCGAKNEDNFALSKANSDGSFSIYCHDNGANGTGHENDPVAFAYVPASAVGSKRLVAMGRVNNDGSTDVSGGSFTVTSSGTGRWHLVIPGHAGGTGTLIVSAEGGTSHNSDNIISGEWDEHMGLWVIESRDLPGMGLQSMPSANDDVFSFAFFAMSDGNGTPPVVSFDSPVGGEVFTSESPVAMTASASDDWMVTRVRFYDGEQLLGEDTSAPYHFVWNGAGIGRHDLNARATDNFGFVTRSETRSIAIKPPAGTGGLYFDGLDDHVLIGSSPALRLPAFTVECWFRREAGGTAVSIGGLAAIPLVAKGGADGPGCDFLLGIDEATGKLAADFKDTSNNRNHPLRGKTVIPTGSWQHAAATLEGDEWKIYLNGNLEASVSTEGSTPGLAVGNFTSLATALNGSAQTFGKFHGLMDEVRIWSRARGDAEIRAGLNTGMPSTPDLVVRFAMGETAGDTVFSSSGGLLTGTMANGVSRTAGAPFNLNVPPGITVTSPLPQAHGVTTNPVLSVVTDDPDDTVITTRFFGRSTESGPLEDFALVALPDTQFYSQNTGGNRAAIFSAQTDWIVSQRTALNIAGVLHLGDITQFGDNPATSAAEWSNASTAMYRLENPLSTMLPHGIPYALAVGNHDQTPIGNADGTTLGFNTYFGVHPSTGVNHFEGKPYYGGTSVPTSADNNFILISAGGIDLIVISLEYDNTPDAEDLEWADSLLKAHPTRGGIVISHWTVGTGNPASFSTQGAAMYAALKDNPNLLLMHGGHIAGEGRRSDTYQGRTVHSLLADYQSRPNGGDGWLRILNFRPSLNRVEVKTYSPTLDRFETDADSQFTLDMDLTGRGNPFVEIDSQVSAPGELTAVWNGLELATRYEWYAEVTDGNSKTSTPFKTFTTAGTLFPPTATITSPENAAEFGSGEAIPLTVNAADTDGSVVSVLYYSGTTLLGESASSPYGFVWNGAPAGDHTILAKAIDNDGLEGLALPIEIRVVPLSPFEQWLDSGGLGAALDDDDGDGLANVVEYYLGRSGNLAEGGAAMVAVPSDEGLFRVTFPHKTGAVDVTAEIQWSTDLKTWRVSGESNGEQTVIIETDVISPTNSDPEIIEATATISSGPTPASFHLRLAVTP